MKKIIVLALALFGIGISLLQLKAYAVVDPNFSCANATDVTLEQCQSLVSLYNTHNGINWTNQENWLSSNDVCTWYGIECIQRSEWGFDILPHLTDNNLAGTQMSCVDNPFRIPDVGAHDQNFSCATAIGVTPAECQSLVDLYKTNNGANWCYQSNWLSSNDVCTWYGVSCSNGNIVDLNVQSNNLVWPLTAGINGLVNLQSFLLGDNAITSVPESIWALTNLTNFTLDDNQLKYLPTSIGNLVNMIQLQVSNNQLIYLPASIGNLVNLETIYLQGNQLVSIPNSMGYLPKLTAIFLSDNHLTSIPSNLWNIPGMETLYLDHNKLVSLPDSIRNLGAILSDLQLDHNCLDAWIMSPEVTSFIDNVMVNTPNWRELAYNTSYCPPIFTIMTGDQIIIDWPTQIAWFTSTGGTFQGSWTLVIQGVLNNSIEIAVNNLQVISEWWRDGVIQWPIPDWFSGAEITVPWYTQLPVLTFQIGHPNAELQFSNTIIVNMYVGSLYDGNTLLIYRSIDYWSTYQSLTSCLVSWWVCTFDSNGFSLFTTLVPADTGSCVKDKDNKCKKDKKTK